MHPILDLWVPVLLVLMMLVVGLGLTVEDFQRLRRHATLITAATTAQILLLPLAAVGLVVAFEPRPAITVGVILLSVCPGGAISNYYAHLVNADVALSIVLTAISSLVSVLTTPIGARLCCLLALGQEAHLVVPVDRVLLQLVLFVLLPIALGMVWRRKDPIRAQRWLPHLNRLTILALVALLIAVLIDQRHAFGEDVGDMIGLAIAFTVVGFTIGASLARLLCARLQQVTTLALEFSVRNLAVMALIAVSVLGRLDYLLFGAVFFIVQMPTALVAVGILKRLAGRRGALPAIES